MLDAEMMEKAKLVQQGLQQFDARHIPIIQDGTIYCKACDTDYPCERMLLFMLMQSLAMMKSLIPSGNMGGIMTRFMGGDK